VPNLLSEILNGRTYQFVIINIIELALILVVALSQTRSQAFGHTRHFFEVMFLDGRQFKRPRVIRIALV
jgi:hypothetical protein